MLYVKRLKNRFVIVFEHNLFAYIFVLLSQFNGTVYSEP